MTIILRDITYEDVEYLTQLGVDNHLESRFKDIVPVDKDSIRKLIYNIVNSCGEEYFGVVAVDDSKDLIVGYMAGFLTTYSFNENVYYAADEMVYVHPKYRGKLVGSKIIKAFTKWAESKGCLEVAIGTISEIATERTKKLYSKIGFKEVGSLFRKRI